MYRLVTVAVLMMAPLAASAQQAPAEPAGRSITRSEFVQRAAEAAGRRFDEIDTTHTGAITREQLRAFRQAHRGGPDAAAAQ